MKVSVIFMQGVNLFLLWCISLSAYEHQIITLQSENIVCEVPVLSAPTVPGVGGALAALGTWVVGGKSLPYAAGLTKWVVREGYVRPRYGNTSTRYAALQVPDTQSAEEVKNISCDIDSALGLARVLAAYYAGTRLHMLAYTLMNGSAWGPYAVQLLQQQVVNIALLRTFDARLGAAVSNDFLIDRRKSFIGMRRLLQRVILAMSDTAGDAIDKVREACQECTEGRAAVLHALDFLQDDILLLKKPVMLDINIYEKKLEDNDLLARSLRLLEGMLADIVDNQRELTDQEVDHFRSQVALLIEIAGLREGHRPSMRVVQSVCSLFYTYGFGLRSSSLKESVVRCVRAASWRKFFKKLGVPTMLS